MKNVFDSEQGVQAIVGAIEPYLAHRAQWSDVEDFERDRPAYNALQAACEATLAWFAGEWSPPSSDAQRPSVLLLQALSKIAPPSRMFEELIWVLQCQSIEGDEAAPESFWRDAISRLTNFLRHHSGEVRLQGGSTLEFVRQLHAAAAALGSNNHGGRSLSPAAWRLWVFFAAEAWQLASGREPRGSDGSPFYQHLDEFQERGLGDAATIPRIGRKVVNTALVLYRDRQHFLKELEDVEQAMLPRDVDSAEWAREFRARQLHQREVD